MHLGTGDMTFRYADSFAVANDLEGYERLILDAMLGNQTLFTRADSIERLWEVATPLLEHPEPVKPYAPGHGARRRRTSSSRRRTGTSASTARRSARLARPPRAGYFRFSER